MAKGHKGKTQTATPNGPDKVKTIKTSDKENSTDTQNLQMNKGRSRNFDKDEHKPEVAEEIGQIANDGQKKAEVAPGVHSKMQPTTEQLMIAKIIQGHSDDPHQQKKIQQVIDVTGKPEDEVATALFDAGWDENKAVELLLEDGDHLSAWEETGKKKKSKKASIEDNDGWGDGSGGNDAGGGGNGGFQDPREKNSRQRGPPRMQHRGRGGSQTKGDRNGRDGGGGFTENGDQASNGRGRGRRRDQPPRRGGRGGRGGGGGRDFSSRQQSNGGGSPGRSNSESVGGFQGSIDTWANPNEQNSGDNSNSQDHKGSRDFGGSAGGGDGAGGNAGGSRGERPHRGGRSGHKGGQSGKDPFDNAGNWGDDFPQAKDWDNEEYTGSLANTKVFTASGDRGAGQNQRTSANRSDQQTQQQPLPSASVTSQPQQQQPLGAVSQRGDYSSTALASKDPSISSTYPQSIDLSTLLQKPTTQSSVESSAVPGAQFNQQATEKLKAVIGIGQTSSNMSQQAVTVHQQLPPTQDPNSSALYSHAQAASDFNSIKSQGQGSQPLQSKGHVAPGGDRTGTQMQPPSSSKAPAVEMPGDSLGRLDVQFGGLDLQFGGSGSANSDAMAKSSGFEFGSASVTQQQDPHKTGSSGVSNVMSSKPVTDSFAPTAKEVNKTLSNALSSSGKLNPMAGSTVQVAAAVSNQSNQQDSFSKSLSSATAPTAINSSSVQSLNHTTNVAPGRAGGGGSAGGGSSFTKQGQSDNQGLSGYSGYNNYNKAGSGGSYGGNSYQYQQYPNSNSFSSQQQQGSAGQSATSSSQYKGAGQYDKYDPSLNNPSAAALGLANTNTTNALSGKVSATTASKVNMPNLPPGVASMLHPQYLAAAGLAPAAAFYGLQQPMYGAYGNTGLGDLAAMPTTGYYDPNNHFAPTTLGATIANRDLGNTNLANLNSLMVGSTSSSTGGNSGNSTAIAPTTLGSTSGFRSTSATSTAAATAAAASATAAATSVNSMVDSTSSPGIATSTGSTGQAGSGTGNTGVGQHHSVQQAQQQQQQQQFNLAATNAFAAQQMPAGYAYYFGNMGNMSHLQPYGATTPGHVYQPTAMTVPGAGAPASQFQKSYGTSYGSGYDALSQQAAAAAGNKDFSSNYQSNGQSKSTGGSNVGGTGKGAHQYWGNTLTGGTQLW